MKKLPLGMQSFRKIIEGDCVYVDKTQYVYDLINDSSYYFMSRPRRFGKSLLLSTIGDAFSGERELFKGLALYDSGFNFEKHPVIRLDMSTLTYKTPETLEQSLLMELKAHAETEGIEITYDMPPDVFKTLIRKLYLKYNKGVVVLIDEYDKPILEHLDDIEVAETIRKNLRNFYGMLKPLDEYLKFTFITGVTKFTKTSIFSELNNLRDITLSKNYAGICGIAIEDLNTYFSEHIKHLEASEELKQYDSISDEILAWYDGYSWDGKTRFINPFSLLNFFREAKFEEYWFDSGTPKFLMDLIKKRPEGYKDLNNIKMSERGMNSFNIQNLAVGPLMFQSGYLTVKEVLPGTAPAIYLLDIPNHEVRSAFNINILIEFTGKDEVFAESVYSDVKSSLEAGNLQGMLDVLKSLFSSIPYQLHISNEYYYHSIFYAVLNLLGFKMSAEVSVSGGIVDGILELGGRVYVMELKYKRCKNDASQEEKRELFDEALSEGMKQIEDRGYCKKYEGSGKAVYRVAFAFLGRSDIEMAVEVFG